MSRLRRIGRSRPLQHNIVALLVLGGATAYGARRVLTRDRMPAAPDGAAGEDAISEQMEPAGAFASAEWGTGKAAAVEAPLNEDQFVYGEKLDGSLNAARIAGSEASGEGATTVVVAPGGRISIKVLSEDHSSVIAAFDLLVGAQAAAS